SAPAQLRRTLRPGRDGTDSDEAPRALRPAGVLALQRTAGNAATVQLLSAPHLYSGTGLVLQRKGPDPVESTGAALRALQDWATGEARRQKVHDAAAVVGLDPKQAASVRQATSRLAAYVPTLRSAGTKFDPALSALKGAVALARDAQKLAGGRMDSVDTANLSHLRTQSADAVAKTVQLLGALSGSATQVSGLVTGLKAIQAALNGGNSIGEVLKYLNRSVTDLQQLRDEGTKRGDAAVMLDILLRGFLAVNDPTFPAAPTAAEVALVRPKLSGGLGEEIAEVFGSSVDYDFFVEFANSWGQQLDARRAIASTTAKPAPAVPDRGDAQAYFGALSKKGNSDVFDAYTGFASAFFVHRGIAGEADLRKGVDDLFSAKASITGRRGLVCTGYATMGAEVLGKAGAKLDGFSVGVHADNDMVLNQRFDEQGHAIARMTRSGTAFCVSNDVIIQTKNALVGKGAISWGDTSKPMFVGDGATMDAAVDSLLAKLAARRRVLLRR
ncbi:MAG TPA: hypothetical protein VFP34_13605, partial [Microlunatus sp.]|nr:hypothetical protein [Microlunatus sp.]